MAWIRKRASSTGVMNASSLLAHLTTSTFNVNLLRTDSAVELSCYARQLNLAGLVAGDTVLTLPTGYRPAMAHRVQAVGPSSLQLDVATTGVVTVISGSAAQGVYLTFELRHLSSDPMPTGGV